MNRTSRVGEVREERAFGDPGSFGDVATGVLRSMDYLLGRNAPNISYVTRYGDVTSKNQHTRIYSHSLDANLPNPPAGSVAGGPNSHPSDPVADEKLQPVLLHRRDRVLQHQRDHDQLERAALLGVLVHRRPGRRWSPVFSRATVRYHAVSTSPGHFAAAVRLSNTGSQPLHGRAVQFALTGAQQVVGSGVGATVTQNGSWVTPRARPGTPRRRSIGRQRSPLRARRHERTRRPSSSG